MSDRSSPEIFATMFEFLADKPTEEHKRWALKLWRLSDNYDFAPETLECNKELEKLGLAHRGKDPDDPDEEIWIYGPARRKPQKKGSADTKATGPWTAEELADKLEYLNSTRAHDVDVEYEAGKIVRFRYTHTGARGRKIWTVLSTTDPDEEEPDTSDL